MRAGTVAAYREAEEGGDGPTLTFRTILVFLAALLRL